MAGRAPGGYHIGMMYTTLISPNELAENLGSPNLVVADCRYSLDDPGRGRRDYLRAHIPRAVYGHLNDDLAGPILPSKTGRHPLPGVDEFAQTLSRWGIQAGTQVVVYDDAGGAIAARLWWMLRWVGHDGVAVLDGGWPNWQSQGYPSRSGEEHRREARFEPRLRPGLLIETAEVLERLDNPAWRIVDSRAPERYRGEHEPIDKVAGRIPGSINVPHTHNVGADGLFLSPEALRERFTSLLSGVSLDRAVFYCGSGVTAARNLLAVAHAGLPEPRFYAGSWSEWIEDPDRPIETG
jgi:thiosulfate/3-mercaptopyruvate sulfurtransferase